MYAVEENLAPGFRSLLNADRSFKQQQQVVGTVLFLIRQRTQDEGRLPVAPTVVTTPPPPPAPGAAW